MDGDDKKKAVMKQWVGLELARYLLYIDVSSVLAFISFVQYRKTCRVFCRWLKDPSVGSAQEELQGDR